MKKLFSIDKNRRLAICLFFFLGLPSSFPLAAQTENSGENLENQKINGTSENYSESFSERTEFLVSKAESMKLYDDKNWEILLLYKKKGSGQKSLIENPEFFLAPDGRTNPKAELEADIRSFRKGQNADKFPARWKFIKSMLSESGEDFPQEFDKDYSEAKKLVNPTSVYLIYPAGFMQNPASMFGHTLLSFYDDKKSRLLGQSVTFSANNTDNPGLVFALKGLFGLYKGSYTIEQYSKQILRYSDLDKRDIWEYKLRLTDDQIDTLLRHALELSLASTKYLYLTQNCTTGLMNLLESVYPDENLADSLGMINEPLEAIKILHSKNLLEEPVYRPSLHMQIILEKESIQKNHGSKLAKSVKSYCKGKISLENLLSAGENDQAKAQSLRLAADYLKHLLSSGKISQTDYQKRIMPVFKAMTKFKFESQDFTSNDYPHQSHDSRKIALSGGYDDGEIFERLSFRLVNHDLIDDDKGLNKNTQLNFFTGALSLYQGRSEFNQKIQVDRLLFADILSLPVSDSYFFNKSLEITCGMERTQFSAEDDFLALRLKFFSGTSFKIWNPNQFYLLAGFDFYAHPDFDFGTDLLPGIEAGLISTKGPWKQHLSASIEQGLFKNDGSKGKSGLIDLESLKSRDRLRFALSVEERLSLTRNTLISAKYTFGGDYKNYKHKAELTAHFNF